MLLSDRDLRDLLPSIAFETDEYQRPFDAASQIQPCSIDLRLDRCFWIPRTPKWHRAIDFREDLAQGQIDISRLFIRKCVAQGEGIKIKPGEMLLVLGRPGAVAFRTVSRDSHG